MKMKINELKELLKQKFISTYYSEEQAKKIVKVLIYAELVGKNTQGALKLLGTEPMYKVKPEYEPKVVKETKVSALIDGGGNPAILVCQMAMDKVIEKCKESGIAIVGTNNTFSSSGVIGYYANEMAKHDLIGMVFAGSPGGVAPFGSLDPLFGTNPLAVGFPTETTPVIFDMATAAITWYGLVKAKTLGQKLPEGLSIDHDGNPTTDPDQAMKGAILPFDKDYKGSGLGLMVEMLTGPLAGGTFANADGNGDWSNIFIAIDPEILIGREQFKKNSTELVNKIKSSRKAPGIDEILVPGEKGLKHKAEIEKTGEIEIEDKIIQELKS